MAAKVFSIFADDRNDHSKMVRQLLSDEVPPIPKNKAAPQRPISANPVAMAARPAHAKGKSNKAANQGNGKDDINKVSR
jgi:hypothetical protein